ncbi:mesenteric estrogen-dependent adipogenesis protein-like isoform X2 [Eleginops maclovinus]|uniref:mesenteric estrogen-dependent adipogenesis protein-like isoform X2 n=1 Tax=Eleginops maclovinus TaxID=56733 RepID=UPI003080CC48
MTTEQTFRLERYWLQRTGSLVHCSLKAGIVNCCSRTRQTGLKRDTLNTTKTPQQDEVTVIQVEQLLKNPPDGFSVEDLTTGYRVHSDPEKSMVLIDDFNSCRGKIVFLNSMGRKVKMQNLREYTSMRKSLLSKKICLLVSACEENVSVNDENADNGARDNFAKVIKQFVVSIDGNDPFIKWQMEKGLDWTISSVAGESYRVDIDLTEIMENWAAKNSSIITDTLTKVKPVWRDASFTLKYYSDALFDFAHWFRFSKRKFSVSISYSS